MRFVKEIDLFRKVPQEHRENSPPESTFSTLVHAVTLLAVAVLGFSEFWTFLTPVARQSFEMDHSHTIVDEGIPKKMRVLLNITIQDFPCIDLSLDYQDVMGTRQVDVKTTVFKQRLHADGTPVGETLRNNPKAAVAGGPANPSISKNSSKNSTCGHCYGALPEGECCNTCSDVLYAYRMKRWALPRIETIEQCKHDGSGRPAYQPPQILRLSDYSYDDYLPAFSKLGSHSESKFSAVPFKLNLSNLTLKPLNLSALKLWHPEHKNFSQDASNLLNMLDDQDYEKKQAKLGYPDCILRNYVIHGYDIGEALMVDLRSHGATDGCWEGNCAKTDKFNCVSYGVCATVCHKVPGCKWWTFGSEGEVNKCWLRSGKHRRDKRFGFSSGTSMCNPETNATHPGGASTTAAGGRRLMSFDDDDFFTEGRRSFGGGGMPSYLPIFDRHHESEEDKLRKEQKDESCQIHGYFDTNKVPGNFHIGTHGFATPSYFSFYDEPAKVQKNMEHKINSLAFVEVQENSSLLDKEPLDGFESPKAFTFQYYLTITPATLQQRGRQERHGYKFRAGSYVTNELIGPAVYFRMDIDPIRVTYYTDQKRWSSFLVNLCAIIGGCISIGSIMAAGVEAAVHIHEE